MEGLERILRELPFFAGLDDEHGRLVTGCARNHRFDAGQYLFREGEPADEFFLVRHGRVALEIYSPGKGPIVFEKLGEGEVVGASWLVPPYRWIFDARRGAHPGDRHRRRVSAPQVRGGPSFRLRDDEALPAAPGAAAACDQDANPRRLREAMNLRETMNMAAAPQRDALVPQIYRVGGVRRELSDTVTLNLVPLAGARPAFEPGQFNMLYAFGIGEVAISVSGSRTDETAFVHTVRNVGAVSGAIAKLEVGACVGVRGPFGTGWPVVAAEGSDLVIVAGGLGLAPLRPAIYHVLANRSRYGRVGCRNPGDMLYRRELEQWRQRLDVELEVTVDHADTEWRGNVGVVPGLISRAEFDPDDTVALVCGPEVMMRFTVGALRDAGVHPERIYLSIERNMKCAIGVCGHCQFGPTFACKDGPVMRYDAIANILTLREV
jgi:NAD(P)H-flavin reductase